MKRTLTRADIDEMDDRYRVKFINSLPGFKSLNLIGTSDSSDQTNLCIVSTVTHFGSNPPLIGYVSRPDSVDRHTLSNIREMGCYSINHVSEEIYQQAHQTSARYRKEVSEFEATGLTPLWNDNKSIPFVAESPISIALSLVDTVEIPVNGTILVLGEVTEVRLAELLISSDGTIDLEAARTVSGSGLDGYFKTKKLARLSYAKPDKPVVELD